MNRTEILGRLFSWSLEHGFSHHSLSEFAEPLGLTRGALGHYFGAAEGGIKAEIARQLFLYAREIRARHLVYPTISYSGGIAQKRAFFVHQMLHYLKKTHGNFKANSWNDPACVLELELRPLIGVRKRDERYLALISELWSNAADTGGFRPDPEQLERLISGPYRPNSEAVLRFFGLKRSAARARRPF